MNLENHYHHISLVVDPDFEEEETNDSASAAAG